METNANENVKSAEQAAAEAAALKAAKEKEAAEKKAAKDKEKAEKKAKKDQEAADKKAKAEQEKADKKAAKEKAEADKKAAAEQKKLDAQKAKEEAAKAKEANRMPEQNGVRRPKPDTLCGKAWAIMDTITVNTGSTATIAAVLEQARTDGLNEGNVKAEYARWRKFNGVSGRIVAPKAEAAPAATNDGASDAQAAA